MYLKILVDTHDVDLVLNSLLESIRIRTRSSEIEKRIKLRETRRRIIEQVREQLE